jgi:ADP-dependent NAD(P)H-hydrate dehydratase
VSTPLDGHPLPEPEEGTDKDERGAVLVVAGSAQTPGAALLSGVAALRAGAGKLKIATAGPNCTAVGVAVPEAMVIPLEPRSAVVDAARGVDAVLVGPGLMAESPVVRDLATVETATLIIDAGSLAHVPDHLPPRTALIPNEDEMEDQLGMQPDAEAAVRRFGAVVAVRGAGRTVVAAPDGRCETDTTGDVGLATSGSGDVLAGIAAGLAARGADPFTAVLWAVHVHGLCGDRLARKVGRVGFLARDLLDEIPTVLAELSSR